MADEQRKGFLLRIPVSLLRELESWAAAELRSVNGQIEYLLREAVQRRKRGPAVTPARRPRRRGPRSN